MTTCSTRCSRPPTASPWCIRATNRAPPTWRSARRSPPRRPQAYAVVPGPGLLNTGAALITAYAMNAPVLGLIGQIPEADIGRGLGHLHEIRDQAGIIARLVDFSARIRDPAQASTLVAHAIAAMASGRRGPAVIECAIDMWGRPAPGPIAPPLAPAEPAIDEDAVAVAARLLGAAKRPMIVCGGGAQGAAAEVTALSAMLQAAVLGYRRGRGVLDSRDPLSVTLPLGRDLWGEADVVLAVGTRMLIQFRQWGIDDDSKSSASIPTPKSPRDSIRRRRRLSATPRRSSGGFSMCCRPATRRAHRAAERRNGQSPEKCAPRALWHGH